MSPTVVLAEGQLRRAVQVAIADAYLARTEQERDAAQQRLTEWKRLLARFRIEARACGHVERNKS